MSADLTGDVELLNIDEENYTVAGADSLDKLSDDNLGDELGAEEPMLKKKPEEDKSTSTKVVRVWHLEWYQDWFDLTTELAVSRLKQALSPWKNNTFYSTTGEKPDLYCPFWIAATLTFLIAAMSNVARNFAGGAKENWRSDAVELTTTSSILAGFCFIVPLILYALPQNTANPKQFVEILSIYGYSLTIYLPGAVMLGIPSHAFRWIVIFFSATFSASFLMRNLWLGQGGWSSPRQGNGIPSLVVIILAPVFLSFLIK